MTIGVLDDNPAICRLLETFFMFAGSTVHAYTDPADFSALLSPGKIDCIECIVVDFQLPGKKTGADVLRQVRMDYPHLPAILISANPIPHVALQGLRDVEILQKPFSLSKLLEAITVVQERGEKLVP